MTTSEATPQDGRRGGRVLGRAPREDGYGVTLLLTILSIAFLASSAGGLGQVVGVALTGVTLLFALRTSGARPRILRAAQVLVGVAIVSAILSLRIGDPRWAATAQAAIGLAVAAIVPPVILARIARSEEITYRLVVGALVVYLLIGLCFAYIFALIALISGQPFFAQTAAPSNETYIYFSYATLATVGYGDYSAATALGQMFAVAEGLFGQLYLVSIVAIVISNIGRSVRGPRGS